MTRNARLACSVAVIPGLMALAALAGGAAAPEVVPEPTVLTADKAVLRTVGNETKGVFEGSVTLSGTNLKMSADRIEILVDSVGDKDLTLPNIQKFKRLLATGHVRIVQDTLTATSGRAEVLPRDEVVILTEDPIVVQKNPDGKESTFAGTRIQWHKGDAALDVDFPRATMPPIRDLGLGKEKDPAAPAGARPEPGPGATQK